MNLSIFTVFLKNRNFISKIRRSIVTDYAALSYGIQYGHVYTLLIVGHFKRSLPECYLG